MTLDLPVLTSPRVVVRLAEAADVPQVVRYFRDNREHLASSRPLVGEEFHTEGFWHAQVRANLAA